MQTLDIISVNLWQILISLANLLLLYLVIKKFLYKPVKNVIAQRQAQIDADYAMAAEDKAAAAADRAELQSQLAGARAKADDIVAQATLAADARGEKIVQEAKVRAEGIVRRAEEDAAQEMKKAEAEARRKTTIAVVVCVIISVIAATVTVGVYLYFKNEKFNAKVNEIIAKIKSKLPFVKKSEEMIIEEVDGDVVVEEIEAEE